MLEISLHAGVGHPVSLVMLALLGLFIGYIAGMFGVGGGFLLTPVLIAIVGVPAPVAVGSALCQKCGTSIASFLKYRHLGRGEPRIDLVMLGGSLIGVDAGTRLLVVLGAASGLMGIGGGVLFMPILLYGFGLSVRNAAGTGVLLLFVTVAVGTFEQALHGFVSLRLALALLVRSSVGSQLGALTTNVLPNRILRLLFAVLVAATVVMIAVDLGHLLIGHQGGR
ncbi:sulfite exporter TauE/SafE family protein [Sorangium sp. So ce448]|uniref:sulfite exporter TauE/SafE family protein n=1 Tax=Sorangium sp. So ce448 TaxID=3133314 RepID=UPI003F63CAC0